MGRVIELEAGERILLRDMANPVNDAPRELEFRHGDMLKVDPSEMGAADAVLMEVCLPTSLHPAVCEKTRELKAGAKLFCFANLALIWPEGLAGPPCHLQPCP